MVKYWLFITNLENWKIISKRKVYGVTSNYYHKFKLVNIGDKVVMYIKGSRIGGTFRIIKGKLPKKEIFKGRNYPYKVKLKSVNIPKEPIELDKDIINKIQFLYNKKNWGSHLMGKAILSIKKEDFDYINKLLQS